MPTDGVYFFFEKIKCWLRTPSPEVLPPFRSPWDYSSQNGLKIEEKYKGLANWSVYLARQIVPAVAAVPSGQKACISCG